MNLGTMQMAILHPVKSGIFPGWNSPDTLSIRRKSGKFSASHFENTFAPPSWTTNAVGDLSA
jgi:hypothetical protein